MSEIRAWNKNTRTGSQSYLAFAEHLPSSFTPIKQTGALPQDINSMRTVRRSTDSDAWFNDSCDSANDIGGGDAIATPQTNNEKSGSIALTALQAGIEQSHPEGPARKKPKSVNQQRSKSAKAPSRLSSLTSEDVGSHATFPKDHDGVTEAQSTLPHSKPKQRAKPRAKSKFAPRDASPIPKEKKPSLFAPKVTKPLPMEMSEATPATLYSPPISNHPNLTTTEHAVKHNSQVVSLSQTTMTLAPPIITVKPVPIIQPAQLYQQEPHLPSYDYESSPGDNPVVMEENSERHVFLQDDHSDAPQPVPSSTSPPACSVLSSNGIFPSESWANQNHEFQGLDGSRFRFQDDHLSPIEENEGAEHPLSMQLVPSTYVTVDTVLLSEPTTHGDCLHDMQSSSNSDIEDPNSGEAKAFTQLLGDVEATSDQDFAISEYQILSADILDIQEKEREKLQVREDVKVKIIDIKPATHEDLHNQRLFPPFTQNTFLPEPEVGEHGLHLNTRQLGLDDEAMLLDDPISSSPSSSEDGADDERTMLDSQLSRKINKLHGILNDEEPMLFGEPSPSPLGGLRDSPAKDAVIDNSIRLSIDKFDKVLGHEAILFDHPIHFAGDGLGHSLDDEAEPDKLTRSENDDFDDGLDDSDLLEILSKDPMLASQVDCVSKIDDRHSPDGSNRPLNQKLNPARTTNMLPWIAKLVPAPSKNLISDHDEEFPMDESDEEEMLKLPILAAGPLHLPLPSTYRRSSDRYSASSEVYDNTTQLSPHKSIPRVPNQARSSPHEPTYISSELSQIPSSGPRSDVLGEGEEWVHPSTDQVQIFRLQNTLSLDDIDEEEPPEVEQLIFPLKRCSNLPLTVRDNSSKHASASSWTDHPDYKPLQTFARTDFPTIVRDRCPIIGLSGQTFLRTCFKIGEMFKEGKRCNSTGQDAIIELFARVTNSSREAGTTKQFFVFADLWRDNPPFPDGILMNYKTTGLADAESKALVDLEEAKMVRCLGRLKRDAKNCNGWLLHIITIRETSWEEIRYTKKIVCAGGIKSQV